MEYAFVNKIYLWNNILFVFHCIYRMLAVKKCPAEERMNIFDFFSFESLIWPNSPWRLQRPLLFNEESDGNRLK